MRWVSIKWGFDRYNKKNSNEPVKLVIFDHLDSSSIITSAFLILLDEQLK